MIAAGLRAVAFGPLFLCFFLSSFTQHMMRKRRLLLCALAVLAVVIQEGDENPALAPRVAESLSMGQTRKLAEPQDIRPLLPKKL